MSSQDRDLAKSLEGPPLKQRRRGTSAKVKVFEHDNQGDLQRRVVWNEEMHRKFLCILFEIGLESAEASQVISELTTEADSSSGDQSDVEGRLRSLRSHKANARLIFQNNMDAALSETTKQGKNPHHAYPFSLNCNTRFMDELHSCPFDPCPHRAKRNENQKGAGLKQHPSKGVKS